MFLPVFVLLFLEDVVGAFLVNKPFHSKLKPIGKTIIHQSIDDEGKSNAFEQIFFSNCYKRYIIQNSTKTNVENSFLFLDEALEEHPNASIVGSISTAEYIDNVDIKKKEMQSLDVPQNTLSEEDFNDILYYLSCLASNPVKGGRSQEKIYNYVKDRISRNHIFGHHTKTALKYNYDRLMDLFTRSNTMLQPSSQNNQRPPIFFNPGLSMDQHTARNVISNFPQLCLYDYKEVEERVKFMISPKPLINNFPGVDWPRYSSLGYGAGLTLQQATIAIQNIPQILALNYYDSQKFSLVYFLTYLRISHKESDMARIQFPHLVGSDAADSYFIAFLHFKLQIGWDQCRILLDAFPTLTYCGVEVGWEIEGTALSRFNEDAIVYLRNRLQIGTKEVLAMMKTHSRLSTYTVNGKIKPTLNQIQSSLGLSSRELRQIILRMPSLIGIKVNSEKSLDDSSFEKHLLFFMEEAKMTITELKAAIIKQPSLLQYNIEHTLRPKLHFLLDDLLIPLPEIPRILKTSPAIMGLSLSNNLRVTTNTIMEQCDLSPSQLSDIIVTSPSILTLSLKGKIEPCLTLLKDLLFVKSELELGKIIYTSPRILLQGIRTSLIPKLHMMEQAIEYEINHDHIQLDSLNLYSNPSDNEKQMIQMIVAQMVKRNPSILCTTNDILRKRLDKFQQKRGNTLLEEFAPTKKGRKRLYSTQFSKREDSNYQNTTVLSFMTNAVQTSGVMDQTNNEDDQNLSFVKSSLNTTYIYAQNISNHISHRNEQIYPRAVVSKKTQIELNPTLKWQTLLDEKQETSNAHSIALYVSGSIFPLDNIKEARGQRKSGGASLYFPQIHRGTSELQKKFQNAAHSSFGMIMPKNTGGSGSNFECGIVSLGFPFLRPSRNRCDLYACYAGLKIIQTLLDKEDDLPWKIDICSNSGYAWKILKDSSKLYNLGKKTSLDSFCCEFERLYNEPASLGNPDILYPLTVIFSKLVDETNLNENMISFETNVNIQFIHTGEMLGQNYGLDFSNQMNFFSTRAAMWQYERVKAF